MKGIFDFFSEYENVSLVIDGMSIKEHVEFDTYIGRSFGTLDYGSFVDVGDGDARANEALVCMLLGYRLYWKLPIAYFLTRGIKEESLQVINL